MKSTSTVSINRRNALKFIIWLGIVSLLADVTYEGARGITGAYLAVLGANAKIVGFVAGLGELIGYSLRMVFGFFTDRSGKYWPFTILGYFINLFAVPALALAHHWETAAALIILERLGKSIRIPARDAMLSHAGHVVGLGWGFGLHEAMDRIGAMLGPLIIAAVLFYQHSYRLGFACLGVPAILALLTLFITRHFYPHPKDLEPRFQSIATRGLPNSFWWYLVGAAFIAAGYADFALMAYHFQKSHLLPIAMIPVSYALAMGVSGFTAPILGKLYDNIGFSLLIGVTVVTAIFPIFVFLGNPAISLLGVVIWSIGMGAQQSLMRAIVGQMVPPNKRGSAYGIFNMGYGVSWFLGSFAMGFIYDQSIILLVLFIVGLQLLSIPWLIVTWHKLTVLTVR